jgi:hypothetical protein
MPYSNSKQSGAAYVFVPFADATHCCDKPTMDLQRSLRALATYNSEGAFASADAVERVLRYCEWWRDLSVEW